MESAKDLVERSARALAASSTISPIAAGPSEAPARLEARIDAINQVFALFRLNYHNQYYKAFEDAQQLAQAKKLWLESLGEFAIETLLLGARRCIEESEYLPTLHRMRECCLAAQAAALGLPHAHAAYLEACRAPRDREAHAWSHPAVYHAGLATGWSVLASATEAAAFPVFARHYAAVCARLRVGETLALPAPASEPTPASARDPEAQRAALARLRREAGI